MRPFLILLFCASLSTTLQAASDDITFRIIRIPDGPRLAIWHPHSSDSRLPLILFSHGFNGCGTQAVFLTESLARAGYVVAAPDHRDASCSVEGARVPRVHLPQFGFVTPGHWTDSTYADRRQDLEKVLDWILRAREFAPLIDPARIGAAGHSLGGYAVLGLAGAWESWRDSRIQAALVLAPYTKPLLAQDRMMSLRVPVMFQSAQLDVGITPALRGPAGAFAQSPEPKYYVELRRATHFVWTNATCWGQRNTADCVEKRNNARLIVEYGVAFFDRYLKSNAAPLGHLDGQGLRRYRIR